jgi:hypothetical protein
LEKTKAKTVSTGTITKSDKISILIYCYVHK